MADITYLRIVGELSENMVYTPKQGWETRRIARRPQGNPDYQLILLDADDRPLVEVSPQVGANGCRQAEDPIHYRVVGYLPLHPGGVSYELRHGELVLYRGAIPRQRPRIEISGLDYDERHLYVEWKAKGQGELHFNVGLHIAPGRTFTLARNLCENRLEADITLVPGSESCQVAVIASDGVRSSFALSEDFSLPPRPPVINLLSPQDGETFDFGQPLTLSGLCTDVGGSALPDEGLIWRVDGEVVAQGARLTALPTLSAGEHTVSLSYGEGEIQSERVARFSVNEPDGDYESWAALVARYLDGPTHDKVAS